MAEDNRANHKHSIMIITECEKQYNALLSIIPFDDLGIFLLPYMPDSQDPFGSLQLLNPSIVIVDAQLLTPATVKHIQKTLPIRFTCRFIVLYDEGVNVTHISSQLGTSTCIEKSTLSEALPIHLDRAIKRLDWNSTNSTFVYEATRLYFNTVYLQSIAAIQSIEAVNDAFGFTFQDGLFRVMIVKLDYSGDPRMIYGRLFPLQKKIEEALNIHLIPYCFEVVLCRTFDGVIVTINYSKESDPQIAVILDHVFARIQQLCTEIPGISSTFCMGKIYQNIGGVCQSRQDAHEALWSRLILGQNRILCTKESARFQFPLHLEAKYEALRYRVQKAYDTLDIAGFSTCVNEIFDAPNNALGSMFFSLYLHSLAVDLFRIQNEEISKFANVEVLKNKTVYVLIMAPTIQAYKNAFLTELTDLMYQIILQKNKAYSSYVQSAISYIKDNYAKPITLKEIADNIGISTSYLSSTFKTETGTGLSNYISFYRIQTACTLLRTTNEPIAQIAESVNIADTTYFSKQFKKYVGTTPSEYRKIFN